MEECKILKHAEELAAKLTLNEIPEDYDFGGHRGIVLADIRHSYSNYDELWHELDYYCLTWTEDYRNANRLTFCKEMEDEYGTGDCELKEKAHMIIKDAINDKINLLIQERGK